MGNINKNIIFRIAISVICIILSIIFLKVGFSKKQTLVYYQENSNIDYNVYLKQNSFFETPFLPKGKTYVSSLIDYIDSSFTYNVSYSQPLNGSYSYYIKAIAEANKPDNEEGSYYTKEYRLTKEVKKELNGETDILIKENLPIKYQEYNQLLNNFKKLYKITIDGKLRIQLIIKNDFSVKGINQKVTNQKVMELNMPLTELSVDIGMDTSGTNDQMVKQLTQIENYNDALHLIYKIIGVILIIATIANTVNTILGATKGKKEESLYNKELKKILSSYDAIIVNIKEMPDLTELKKIYVNSFEELLDAHSEIRMPINYYEKKKNKISMFILINDNIVWLYELKNK